MSHNALPATRGRRSARFSFLLLPWSLATAFVLLIGWFRNINLLVLLGYCLRDRRPRLGSRILEFRQEGLAFGNEPDNMHVVPWEDVLYTRMLEETLNPSSDSPAKSTSLFVHLRGFAQLAPPIVALWNRPVVPVRDHRHRCGQPRMQRDVEEVFVDEGDRISGCARRAARLAPSLAEGEPLPKHCSCMAGSRASTSISWSMRAWCGPGSTGACSGSWSRRRLA